jgi:hypothetical protein
MHEKANQHTDSLVFLLTNLFSGIPFLFLISLSSSLVFYFLVGLRDEFSLLMYFILNIFMCLLANEALMMVVAYIWHDTFKGSMTLIFLNVSVQNSFPVFFYIYCYCLIWDDCFGFCR